jgi:hypothetical protein
MKSVGVSPELLRIKGGLLLADGRPDAAVSAEEQFLQALDWARRQDVLSWELRAATSLARFWRPTSDHRSAPTPRRVYMKFTGGFETADLLAARTCCSSWRSLRELGRRRLICRSAPALRPYLTETAGR